MKARRWTPRAARTNVPIFPQASIQGEYLELPGATLSSSLLGRSRRIAVRCNFPETIQHSHRSGQFPGGLIVNELVTNAFKHAFPGERGTVSITFGKRDDGQISSTVADDGVGLPPISISVRPNPLGCSSPVAEWTRAAGTPDCRAHWRRPVHPLLHP